MTILHTKLVCYALSALLLLHLAVLQPQQATAGDLTVPVHYISLAFDLQASTLQANSRIILPADVDLHLDLAGLDVSRVVINGQDAAIGENYTLDIPTAAREQEILLSYSKRVPPGSSPYDLISETGITLISRWYPEADREMLFKLTAVVPDNFEAVSEADEIQTSQVNGSKQVNFRFPHPLFAINFIAGPYVSYQESFGQGKTLAAYFFPEDQALAADYMAKAKGYLQRYENLLGPYPYSRFAIVENRLPTGFAMPTFTLLGQAVVRLPFIVDTSLGHEVLHAWFGNGVRMSPLEGNWVEGLPRTTKEQLVKYQSFVRPDMDLDLRNFSNVGHQDMGGQPIRAVGYNKSSMVFHMLRNKLGQETFIAALRDFYKRLKFKSAGWTDLETSFENTSGMNLAEFFTQWLDRSDVPVLTVNGLDVTNNEGYPVLRFNIVQTNETPYTLEVPVVIQTTAEEIHKTLQVSEQSTPFEIPLAAVPEALVIDPDYDLMRELTEDELPPTWSRFQGAADRIAILADEKERGLYNAMLTGINDEGLHVLLQNEVTDKDLAENSLLFLGTNGDLSRSLFAGQDHPKDGFILDVRNNPLNPVQVAVLVTASDSGQVELAAAKLRHYGKYSYLSFKDGRIQDKKITATDTGIYFELVTLPTGMRTSAEKNFAAMIEQLLPYRVVYIGEGHTNYEDHLLQLEIARALYEQDPRLAIGMEMFSRESQPVLDRYLAGEIDEKTFLKDSHYFKTWRFDYRLYRDIINFAKYNHLPVVALNLEQDLASKVFKGGGPGSLDTEEAVLLPAERNLDEPGYRERIAQAYMMHAGTERKGDFSGFLQAQVLWDETMAETAATYLEDHPEERMVIIAGRGHVDKKNAIPPRLERRLPVNQAVVLNSSGSTADSDNVDFVFFSPPALLPPLPLLGVMLDDTENEEGVLVTALNPQGQGAEAGIREKDIILAIDSEPVNDLEDVKIAMLYKEDKDSVTVRVKRHAFLFGNKELEIEVPLKSAGNPHRM